MKIALIGYGKMGKAIEEIALSKGHTICLKINDENLQAFTPENLKQCDVAIEFTGPESAKENVLKLLNAGIPVVCGSTGWTSHLPEIEKRSQELSGSFLYASNFSVGVNLFFSLNKTLAELMKKHTQYKPAMEEIHHTQKKDAPSGTAITLAEDLIATLPNLKTWINEATSANDTLPIISKREDPAPGTHIVSYISEVDEIEIKHTAKSRRGFAEGAVLAAEFIKDKKGIFTMQEVLGL